MKIIKEANYEALSKKSAEIIRAQVSENPASVLGLATGSTPTGTYEELVRMYKQGAVDFAKVSAFNLDEYFPIKKSSDQSYDYFMKQQFFRHVNVAKTFIPNGEAPDYAAECENYEKQVAESGGIDLQLLGIGNNGHIGFNEPNDYFPAATHYVMLDESTIKANARFFANESDVPRHAITMGIRTIFKAKKILLLASGAGKAEIVKQMVSGKITPQNPSSILQLHPDVTIIVDNDAGRLL
ncbi:MAG: glucosamine-6-phosphate deaminase [Defluviitaleaceae bacterium]|nr:glucosamine-6-phosphate deaminase [Defluviitaleaceae bacterium]